MAPYLITLGTIVTTALVVGIASGNPAVFLSLCMATGVVLTFVIFLLSMTRSRRDRSVTAIVTYVFANIASIIVLFGNAYRWIGVKDTLCPADHSNDLWDGVYLSAVTWTTLGYGDVVPLRAARPIAAAEGLVGYLIMGLLISVLIVSLQE